MVSAILTTFLAIVQKKLRLVSGLGLPVPFEFFFLFFFGQFLQSTSIFSCLFQVAPRKKVGRLFFGLTYAVVVPGFGPYMARMSE